MAANDKQAFVAEIVANHGRRLRRYLAARLRNPADVSDLVQEVYLRLVRVERQESIRSPEAYLMTVASHVLYQHALRGATRPHTVDAFDALIELHSVVETDEATQLDAQRRLEELDQALAQLSPKAHATFVLHRRDGFTLEEIGKQLGVSRPMVKKYLAKAVLRCREHFAKDK